MLWLPPAAYREIQNNLPATPSNTAPGTVVTASATPFTKGAWTALLTTDFDVNLVCLHIHNQGAGGNNYRTLVDVAIGPAAGGSEQIVLPDLLAGAGLPMATAGLSRLLVLPLYIPAGLRVSARASSATASRPVDVNLFCYGGPRSEGVQAFVGADAYGITAGASSGTVITPGSTGTESAWLNIGGTTSRAYSGLIVMMQGATDTAMAALAYHTEVGYNSGAPNLGEFFFLVDATEHYAGPMPPLPIFASIPSGTQLQARSEAQGTAEVLDVALYGLY